jgi:hypothetical protein
MFTDALRARLEVSVDDRSFVVPAGDLKRLAVSLEPWGYTGSATWWIVDQAGGGDPLFASFLQRSMLAVKLTLARAFDDPDAKARTLVLTGLVTSRQVVERTVADVAGSPVLRRRYSVTFADRAKVLWSQHQPTAIHVDGTLQALVDAHVPSGMSLSHRWSGAAESHPVLSVGLGAADDGTSFYDFVQWLLDARRASLAYDLASDAYTIVDSKRQAAGTPKLLERANVTRVDVAFPATPRPTSRLLNAFAGAATRKTEVPNDQSVRGLVQDFLVRTPLEDDVAAHVAIEAARSRAPGPEWRVTFGRFPAVPLAPGDAAQLDSAFGPSFFASGKPLRVVRVSIAAHAVDESSGSNVGDDTNRYEMDYEVVFEDASDPVFRRPAFRLPRWPFRVEGQVVSETGQEGEATYEPYTDATTSLDRYKVHVPLWALDVVASFEPNLLPGHFYFPGYKGARVLIALWFDRAGIVRFLDWRDGARLPVEAQGSQLLMGKAMTNGTSVQHVYQNGTPALVITRSNGSDVQTIAAKQGTIRIETRQTSDESDA